MANTLQLKQDFPDIEQSLALYRRAEQIIPAGTQTLAKGVGQYVRGVAPIFLERGKGARVWDVDGNEYLDYSMAVGPLSLGYCFEPVDAAIRRQLESGIVFSLPHRLEVEVAELISSLVPNAEMVRFSKTGADVTSAAVRVARAVTGRSTVLCCGYHGWHDWSIATTDRNAGIPPEVRELSYTFEYNKLETLYAALDGDVAAVIVEPVVYQHPERNFLHRLREHCTRNGTILIFDEMWTGFRLAMGGAQEYYGVNADLICFSKAIANGMPLSVLCGKREYMRILDHDVFFFTTFGGETLSLAAAKATIQYMKDNGVPIALESRGRLLQDGINFMLTQLDISYIRCIGPGARSTLQYENADLLMKSYIQQELIRRGILWNGSHTMSWSHSLEDIDYTLAAYHEVFVQLRQHVLKGTLRDELKGAMLEPVFRRTSHFHTKPRRSADIERDVERAIAQAQYPDA